MDSLLKDIIDQRPLRVRVFQDKQAKIQTETDFKVSSQLDCVVVEYPQNYSHVNEKALTQPLALVKAEIEVKKWGEKKNIKEADEKAGADVNVSIPIKVVLCGVRDQVQSETLTRWSDDFIYLHGSYLVYSYYFP